MPRQSSDLTASRQQSLDCFGRLGSLAMTSWLRFGANQVLPYQMLKRFPGRFKSLATTKLVTQFASRSRRALGQSAKEVRSDAVEMEASTEPSGGLGRVPLGKTTKRKEVGASVDFALDFAEDGAHLGCTTRGAR